MKDERDFKMFAIETSCDETAAAVVKGGKEVLSNVIASQVDSHRRFGGVVPEVASRHHVEQMTMIFSRALEEADVTWEDIDAVAVTCGPGLVGALLVGINAAKALSFAKQLPLVPVHHLAGHIYASRLIGELEFPLVALVVSGGHTDLIYMKSHGHYEVIGQTRDDAAGEAYDKIARTLALPYPGGPEIDRLAARGEDIFQFPRAWLEPESYDFSFSGLKSAVLNRLNEAKQKGEELKKEDVACSFQESVIEVLVTKTMRAVKDYEAQQLVVAGGVAANSSLRQRFYEEAERLSVPLFIPPPRLCTDNAAMIAAAGTVEYFKGRRADMRLNAFPGLEIESFNTVEKDSSTTRG